MTQTPVLPETESRWSRRWLQASIACLLLAGGFALAPLLGRMPPLDRFVTDPEFFRRCLVVHVNLALVAWFHAFIASLAARLPGASPLAQRAGLAGFAAGIVLLLATALIPGASPLMSNYIPALDHPLFLVALSLLGLGLGLAFLDALRPSRRLPAGAAPRAHLAPEAALAVRAAAFAFLVALVTFAVSAATTPAGLSPHAFHEAIFWGGGHVLQVATVAAMLACWLHLLTPRGAGSPVPPSVNAAVLVALCAPLLLAPWLASLGTMSAGYRLGFTRLMQFGLAPPVLVHLAFSWRALARLRATQDPLFALRRLSFLASGGLIALGFGLGAAIRSSTTLIPAHYHAAIGAITTAFMADALVRLAPSWRLSASPRLRRLALLQPLLFGGGQLLLVLGFAVAGLGGAARKAYGAEQAARGFAESVGLVVMGLGGLVAIAGGILFLRLIVPPLARRWAARPAPEWSPEWLPPTLERIRSRS